MAGNRRKAEAYWMELIKTMDPVGKNTQYYQDIFKGMSDADFDKLMHRLKDGDILPLYMPNGTDKQFTTERAIAVGKKIGVEFFERLWVKGEPGMPDYLTPIKHMVVLLPSRRASQLLNKKMKVPKHSNTVSTLTGQVTGDSKGASISYPELALMSTSANAGPSIEEFIKFRGGDRKGYAAYKQSLAATGHANTVALREYASGVESTRYMKTIFNCMMFEMVV